MRKTLVLNSSYQILGVKDWKYALCAYFKGEITILSSYPDLVRSPSLTMKVPAVVIYNKYKKLATDKFFNVRYTHNNIFIRDNYTCQYCGRKTYKNSGDTSTELEHVKPRSKGGLSTWENTVTACRKCNRKKGDLDLSLSGMSLLRAPKKPSTVAEVMAIRLGYMEEEWQSFLYI